jgi:hypothetical protein
MKEKKAESLPLARAPQGCCTPESSVQFMSMPATFADDGHAAELFEDSNARWFGRSSGKGCPRTTMLGF